MATLFELNGINDVTREEGDGYTTISFFLSYVKNKDNINGDPVPKQGDRTMLMPSKDAKPIEQNGKKYYLKTDFWIKHYLSTEIEKNIEHMKKQLMVIKMQNHFNFLPFTKKVAIEQMIFFFYPLKSFTKKQLENISNGQYQLKDTRPDLDNLEKNVCDFMNGIIYSDDGKIVRKNNIFKCYSMKPGVFIKIKGEL